MGSIFLFFSFILFCLFILLKKAVNSCHYIWLILVLLFSSLTGEEKNVWLLHAVQWDSSQCKLTIGLPGRGILASSL